MHGLFYFPKEVGDRCVFETLTKIAFYLMLRFEVVRVSIAYMGPKYSSKYASYKIRNKMGNRGKLTSLRDTSKNSSSTLFPNLSD